MSLTGRTPAAPVGGEAAGGDNAMDVRMKCELARPRVQHGRDAEFGPEPLRIVAEGEQGLGGGPQEQRNTGRRCASASGRRAAGSVTTTWQ
jgi:hypothetical protein